MYIRITNDDVVSRSKMFKTTFSFYLLLLESQRNRIVNMTWHDYNSRVVDNNIILNVLLILSCTLNILRHI